ncbi:putative oxidoreductase [Rhodococcus sp. 27YEA15]|uniref:DoxX family protein n=1 Tax=Rhodococcus sp. 27YEA15 TaxID=3156259 RepID=UPI003C7BCD59
MDHDLGLFVLRLALGPMLVAHGWNKAFGPGGLQGTTSWFTGLGMRPAWLHARIAAASEVGVGVLLAIGFMIPLASAACVGLMVVAALTDHRGKGYFVFKGGFEYVVMVAMVAIAVVVMGPGAWSMDHVLGLDNWSGVGWASGAAVVGCLSALGFRSLAYSPR